MRTRATGKSLAIILDNASIHKAKSINGGIKELLSQFRKIMHARINQKLVNPPNIGIGIWDSIL